MHESYRAKAYSPHNRTGWWLTKFACKWLGTMQGACGHACLQEKSDCLILKIEVFVP